MLERLLQTTNARVSLGVRWLYWDESTNEWVVLTHPYGKHSTPTVYRGASLDAAINALVDPLAEED